MQANVKYASSKYDCGSTRLLLHFCLLQTVRLHLAEQILLSLCAYAEKSILIQFQAELVLYAGVDRVI